MAADTASAREKAPAQVTPVTGGPSLPRHVAIIMDGNGRWANARGLSRADGHRRGVEAVRGCVRDVGERGIDYLTLFGFSSENWSRPKREVTFLLDLLRGFIRRDLVELNDAGVRVRVLGTRTDLPADIQELIRNTERTTEANVGLQLQIAFNYGGRDEIVRAVRRVAADVARGALWPDAITEDTFAGYLDTAGIPEPDLLIRTSGEQRISNFLLWQCAYTEFVFLDDFWPEFDARALDRALKLYGNRERRFGGLAAAGS